MSEVVYDEASVRLGAEQGAKVAREETLRDVIVRLEGFGVDPDVIAHFRSLL